MRKNTSLTRLSAAPLLVAMSLPISMPALAVESSTLVLEEIVVSARRMDESLQDVPETVNAVTGDTFQKMNLISFEDVSSVLAGVNLEASPDGYNTTASIRGAAFDINSGAAPTVQFYVNEAPVESNQVFTAMYDLAQIEVLRGPQGTLRGRSSPSGAITVKSQAPVLDDFGGYVSTTQTDQGGSNIQGAVNLPLIEGKLALRVAGVIDNNELSQVKSINNSKDPESDTDSHRISLLWQVTDDLDVQLMHQKTDVDKISYNQVAGPGVVNFFGPTGPAIDPEDRLSVMDSPNDMTTQLEVNTLNVNWSVLGHTLSYVAADSQVLISGVEAKDYGNAIPSYELFYQHRELLQDTTSHELLLASEEPFADFIDYSIGIYQFKKDGGNDISIEGVSVTSDYSEKETAVFGSINLHLTDATDLTLGARHIKFEKDSMNNTMGIVSNSEIKESTNVYRVSLSHRFTEELLGYVTWGSSWRAGPDPVILQADPTHPQYQMVSSLDSEEAQSWEIGVKADFMNGRARVNAAVYRQTLENYFYTGSFVTYNINPTAATPSTTTFEFTSNADAVIEGIEIDASFQATANWVLSGSMSWNDSELESAVPCNGVNGVIPAGAMFATCKDGRASNLNSDWSANLQSEYTMPINDALEAYVRGLYSYNAENDNKHQNYKIDAYGLFNLYVGLRDESAGWEVQLFAKNLFDEGTELTRDDVDQVFSAGPLGMLDTGYYLSGYTQERELGVNVRYNF